ncbi:MAG: SGNH/GDSL hydrolase family protein [Magnetococcales bacterium]|nr:SGNH/GDSL hydrolase family protein [Magnetococcales bacterium]MBF0155576.1 SGNH/GDSL hydrolase family protein [Magnetococcales bacterium]
MARDPESKDGGGRFFHRHPGWTLTGIVIVALVGLDLGLGACYRWVVGDSFYYSRVDFGRGLNRRYRSGSPVFHHGLKPLVSMRAQWGEYAYTVHTNALGFKDGAAVDVPLVTDRYRILFIGDSVTEGVGMSHEDTFVGRIGEALKEEGVEVLNAGVSSYAPSLYLAKVRHYLETVGLKIDELVVFLDISDPWDEIYRYPPAVLAPPPLPEEAVPPPPVGITLESVKLFFREYSILYSVPRWFKLRQKFVKPGATPADNPVIDYPRGRWTFDDQAYREFGEPGLEVMRKNMEELARLLRGRGIPLTVVVYPWPGQIYYRDIPSRQEGAWAEWAGGMGADFLSLFGALVTTDAATNRDNILGYYIPNDMHFNQAGHELVAARFVDHWRHHHPEGGKAN